MGCSVLLVDDEESVRTSIELYLLDKGYKVYTAATAAEGGDDDPNSRAGARHDNSWLSLLRLPQL